MNPIIKSRITSSDFWKRLWKIRAGEPFLYNLFSIWVYFFGDFSTKVDYDMLITRPEYGFGIKHAFEIAAEEGVKKILFIEFGCAAGQGLYTMLEIANNLKKNYGIEFEIIGFDTGQGMPTPKDFRDHPEMYRKGDFPKENLNYNRLPRKINIYEGSIKDTLREFINSKLLEDFKISFVAIDVDYYSSTIDCLDVFLLDKEKYISKVVVHFDDIKDLDHNEYCGEKLAIKEFNLRDDFRKLCKMNLLKTQRYFKNAPYLDLMYYCHIFDHERRDPLFWKNTEIQLMGKNPFIDDSSRY